MTISQREKCEACGDEIDKSVCNQTYAIHTTMRDSDLTGMKKDRIYLCVGCNLKMLGSVGL
jgi:hypothetical protein